MASDVAFDSTEASVAAANDSRLDLASRASSEASDEFYLGFWIALQQLRGEEVRASQNMLGEFIRLIVGTSGKTARRRHIEDADGGRISKAELDAEWATRNRPLEVT